MSSPPRLYKYEALTTRALLNLKSQIVHFGSPLNFNDPYDCALTPNIATPSDDEVESVRQACLQDRSLPSVARREFETFTTEKIREVLLREAHKTLKSFTEEFLAKRGVACFSEFNDDLLMWSHYGGRYKGFCLEFSTSTELFSKIHQVRYVPTLPSISVAAVLLDHDFDPVQDLFCTKSVAWSYEKEWRAIHNGAGTEFGYPAEALTGIYFGPDIDRQSLEMVCLILAGQNETARLWKGTRSTTEFRVLFEKFMYTSHLEAKRNGLL